MKARRTKSMKQKFKSVSEHLEHLINIQFTEQAKEKQQTLISSRYLSRKFRHMINIQEIDVKVRKKCINLSYDLQFMNSADRLAFLYDDPTFPKDEKILMLNTCISVMEQIEDYEVCATLDRMRKYMFKNQNRANELMCTF